MKKGKTRLITALLTCSLLLATLASAALTAFAANSDKVISQSAGATIDEEKGVLLCYSDFETKTVEMTGYEASLLSSADIDVEDEKWINSNPYGGYIHMAGHPDKPPRTVIRFIGGDGVRLDKGTIVATSRVAAKEPTQKTLLAFSDKITYADGNTDVIDHAEDYEKILNASGGWVNITSSFTIPENAKSLLSYEIDYHATCYHYVDDVQVWYYPENAFIINEGGSLSMTIPSGDSYTFPRSTLIAGWVCDGKVYRPGDTVDVSEISNKTLMAREIINIIDADKVSFEYKFENDRAGNADGTMTITVENESLGNAEIVELLWGYGNAEDGYKPLEDYTPLKSDGGWKFPLTYTINKDLALPPEANAMMLAMTDHVSTKYIVFPIPEHKLHPAGEPLYTAAFISDVHVGWSGLSLRPSHLAALNEINEFAVDHTVVVGDFVQWYGEHAMAKQWEIARKYFIDYNMPVYFAKGNHDEPNYKTAYIINKGIENYDTLFSYEYYDEWLDNWFKYSKQKGYYDIERVGPDIDYYATEIQGHQYVFLAVPNEGYYKIDDEQLEWVEKELFRAEESGKPIFVLCHVPLKHKVSHIGHNYQGGYDNAEKLEEILALHPNVIYISGDTHYTVDSETQNTVNGAQITPSYVNDGAVIDDVWKANDESDYYSGRSKQPGDLTQGLIAEVYSDRILIRGRYFITEKWISQGLSEITFKEKCPIEQFEVTKQATEDGSLLLTTSLKSTDGLTFAWYLDGELQADGGAALTIPADYAGYIALRVTDADGNYRSELYDSLSDVGEFVEETETTEAPTTEPITEVTTEEITEVKTEATTEEITEATEKQTEDNTEATEKQTEVNTEDKTEEATEPKTSKGCGSSLSGIAGVIASTAAGAAIALKKKKED